METSRFIFRGNSLKSLLNNKAPHFIDDDEIDIADTPGESADISACDKQRASLQTYLDSLPYKCESVEEMQGQLEQIIEKIYICSRRKNWLLLSTWDDMLQRYGLLMIRPDHATHSILVGCS